jgi:AraC-like DNA-binding protein
MFFLIFAVTPFYVTFLWSLVFLTRPVSQNRARFLLGIFMFLSAVLYFCHASFFLGFHDFYINLDTVYLFASLSVFPVYYWYVKLLTVETNFNFQNLWHFFPALCVASIIGFFHAVTDSSVRWDYFDKVLIKNDFSVVVQKDSVGWMARIFFLSRIVFAVQVFVYLIRGYKFAHSYNSRVAEFYSNLKDRQLIWVKMLSIVFLITSASSIVFNFLGRGIFLNEKYLLIVPSLMFSALLFLIGYQGSLQNYTVKDFEEEESEVHILPSGGESREKLRLRLIRIMEDEELYRMPDLRITTVCKKLNTNRTYVSGVINEEFGDSFNSFVNRYRVKYACDIMKGHNGGNYSLDYLAAEAGFGSTSSFIRSFKQFEGVTPGKYLRSVEN